jgi:hypothetical protein
MAALLTPVPSTAAVIISKAGEYSNGISILVPVTAFQPNLAVSHLSLENRKAQRDVEPRLSPNQSTVRFENGNCDAMRSLSQTVLLSLANQVVEEYCNAN